MLEAEGREKKDGLRVNHISRWARMAIQSQEVMKDIINLVYLRTLHMRLPVSIMQTLLLSYKL